MKKFNFDYFKKITSSNKSINDRCIWAKEYLYSRFEHLGSGSFRSVYKISKDQVIKVAHSKYDACANENEVFISEHYEDKHNVFAKVQQYNLDYIWVISKYVKSLSDDDIISNFNYNNLKKIDPKFDPNDSYYLAIDINNKKYFVEDLCPNNMGIINKKLIIIDYGNYKAA